jgi:hypothetical protein
MAVTWIHYDARVRKAYYRPTSWRGFKSERFEGMGSSGRCMVVME